MAGYIYRVGNATCYDTQAAAERAGVSIQLIRYYIAGNYGGRRPRHRLEAKRFGNRYLIRLSELRRFARKVWGKSI